jgi:hypothetical protein
MTWRELYEYALIEVNKLKAPSLLLEDYNYFINKAVQQYMNLVYNRYDINQQSNDDLRVLTTTKVYNQEDIGDNTVTLPSDYVHLLNCIVTVSPLSNSSNKCGSSETSGYRTAAKQLTSDRYAGILNNYYLKPAAKRPYYMLKSTDIEVSSTSDIPRKGRGETRANQFDSLLKIECGNGSVSKIEIDYVRAPQKIELTDEDIFSIDDNSPHLEFPDYVCFEIVNIFTKLLMENAGDPRLQTNPAVNNTISGGV